MPYLAEDILIPVNLYLFIFYQIELSERGAVTSILVLERTDSNIKVHFERECAFDNWLLNASYVTNTSGKLTLW